MEITKVFIKQALLQMMEEEVRKTTNKVETGGVLMGYYTVKNEIVITHCSSPGPNAKQKKHSIFFDITHAQKFVNKIYNETCGNSTYLGDWHSHTSPVLCPSITDKRELTNIVKSKASRLQFPLMIICSMDEGNFVFKAYYLANNKIFGIEDIYLID